MKKIFYILLIFSFVTTNAQIDKSIDLNWHTNFDEAKQMANSQDKLILIYFTGSDWSQPCKLLNQDFFYTEKFQQIAKKHLVLVRVNSPRRPNLISDLQKNKNSELSTMYNQKVYPTVVLTDAQGKKLGILESYNYLHDTSKHYALINKVIKK
ncbi:MAG: thioredoxin family protein [Aureibaculum sp.]|jgi:thioredoxin-related protein